MNCALLLSPLYSWRNWDKKVSLTCSQAHRWEEVKPEFEIGHTDLGTHTLDHCVKICLTSLWRSHFFRSQHWAAGWQPHQNNSNLRAIEIIQQLADISSVTLFLITSPQWYHWWQTTEPQQCQDWGLDFSTWPLIPGLLDPVHSLWAPKPVFTFKVTTRLIEPEMLILMPSKSQKTM